MNELTDTEIRERLLAFGYASPPITSTSRRILLKKLQALETGSDMKSSNDSDQVEDDDEPDTGDTRPPDYGSINSPRYRSQKSNFIPENIGMYSRCFARHIDFWDRIGFYGTTFILVVASVLLFFLFKTGVQWSDKRFRSVYLTNPVISKCSQGGVTSMTCVPDADVKFVHDNINTIRSVVHEATVTNRCGLANYKSNDFVGIFPLFNDSEIVNLLVQNHKFDEPQAEKLLQHAKVFFKANPQYEIKWLNEGILYRNYRLLRTCSYMPWSDSIYQYAAYAVVSFTLILITYKTHRWVNRLRNEGDQERRRLIKDIADILKQNQKLSDTNYVSVKQMQDWILSAVHVKPKLWDEVMTYIKEHDTGIVIEKRNVRGLQCDVFRLQN
jgi:hypothetical protein